MVIFAVAILTALRTRIDTARLETQIELASRPPVSLRGIVEVVGSLFLVWRAIAVSRPTQDLKLELEFHATPAEYSEHPLVRHRLYFTLPELLLDCLAKKVGDERFDAGLWEMELALTRACGGEDGVGFWDGVQIQFPLLRYQPLKVDPLDAKGLGWTDQQLEAVNTVGRSRTERFATTARGYAGWLLTNRAFLAEHNAILLTWQAEIQKHQIPLIGPVVQDASQVPEVDSQPGEEIEQFVKAFEAFFIRWRLGGLTAPYLPSPLRPQMPVAILASVLGHMRDGGRTFYMPDTFPVPTRDELRDLMEDALRGPGTPAHLAEWIANVQTSNSAKNTIQRYARLFELQHYVRTLYQRHAAALRQRKSSMTQAFATFLKVSDDTIEKDLAFVAEKLGDEWYLMTPLQASPNP